MNTIARVEELAAARKLSLFKLSQKCNLSYSTLKSARQNGKQLSVDTIEIICVGLGITMADFFTEKSSDAIISST